MMMEGRNVGVRQLLCFILKITSCKCTERKAKQKQRIKKGLQLKITHLKDLYLFLYVKSQYDKIYFSCVIAVLLY